MLKGWLGNLSNFRSGIEASAKGQSGSVLIFSIQTLLRSPAIPLGGASNCTGVDMG